jgi:CRISPR-associated protein Csb2
MCIEKRYEMNVNRFRPNWKKIEFANATRPRFRSVAYNSSATHFLFDLRRTADSGSPLAPWPLQRVAVLAQKLRDGAVEKLKRHYDDGKIYKTLIGRDAMEADKALRVRIVPIPSIGFIHADRGIRRVMVEAPPDCPIRADDVAWAFAGLPVSGVDMETGEILSSLVELVAADDYSMLEYYGLAEARASNLWRSVTPLALPDSAKRRRIDPAKLKEEAKSGKERQAENCSAIYEVAQALRHAGLRHRIANIRVQREPFEARGERAEAFADATRFSKHQLWHVEIEFAESISGPLIIGDGRYLGLGLMAPVKMPDRNSNPSYARYALHGASLPAIEKAVLVGEWLRMGLMGKAKRLSGDDKIPQVLSGHDMPNDNKHEHAFYLPEDADGDGHIDHITVYAKAGFSKDMYRVLSSMTRLWNKDGKEWQLILEDIGPLEHTQTYASLLAASAIWTSITPYLHPWFAKKNLTIEDQIKKECRMRGLPEPVTLERLNAITINGRERTPIHFHRFRSKRGLTQPDTQGSFWKLTFSKPISGPLALGFGCHYGLGMFNARINTQ